MKPLVYRIHVLLRPVAWLLRWDHLDHSLVEYAGSRRTRHQVTRLVLRGEPEMVRHRIRRRPVVFTQQGIAWCGIQPHYLSYFCTGQIRVEALMWGDDPPVEPALADWVAVKVGAR